MKQSTEYFPVHGGDITNSHSSMVQKQVIALSVAFFVRLLAANTQTVPPHATEQ
jgi:hypothetical protein